MKKNNKVLALLFTIVIVIIGISRVNAEKYTCSYNYSLKEGTAAIPEWRDFLSEFGFYKKETGSVKFTIDTEEKKFYLDKKNTSGGSFYIFSITDTFLYDTLIDSSKTEEQTVIDLDGKCPSAIYTCKFNHIAPGGNSSEAVRYGFLLNPTLYSKIPKGEFNIHIPNTAYAWGSKNPDMCPIAIYDSQNSSGESNNQIFSCDYYDQILEGTESEDGLKKLYCNLNNKECTNQRITLYNEKKDHLKSYCKSILQYADYINPCLTRCLNLSEDLKSIEGNNTTNNDCGFSDRLMNWVINIFKWIKYILPVIVIILGIIDFIKAIGSEKEDEMKKSQGRFVKRLIAAALVFIVPFIIEFILEKLGFSSNSCGLW